MEKSILDELFEAKCDNFEEERMKKEKGCNDKYYSSLEKTEAIVELVPETNRKYAKECYEQLVRNFGRIAYENDFIDEKELERERQNLNKIIAQVKEKLL